MPRMNLLLLLDHLETLTTSSFSLAGKVWLDREELVELIKKIQIALPEDIKEAEWIAHEKERYLAQAQEEAKRIVREAENYAERLVREDQIVVRANEEAKRILTEATQNAQAIEKDALEYAGQILEQLEVNLERTIRIVRKGRDEIKNQVGI